MSLKSAGDFANDFIYNSARCYFIYPITIQTAAYTMLPVNYFSNLDLSGEDFDIEDFKTTIREYLRYAEIKYGDDYVEQGEMETLSVNVGAELDLLAFELELEDEDEEGLSGIASDDDLLSEIDDEEDDFFDDDSSDEYEFSNIDKEILQDPILMLKHIEQNLCICQSKNVPVVKKINSFLLTSP